MSWGPAITFGPECSFDTIDTLISSWAANIHLKDGSVICAAWGYTAYNDDTDTESVAVSVWSDEANDFVNDIFIPADNIEKVEIL